MRGLDILWGGLDNHLETIFSKFMSGCLYFSNNLQDIKDHIQAGMINCKIVFQLMVKVFKKLNLQLPLIFYSSIRFVFETTFISEQIAESLELWRCGGLLEIRDKLITKFKVFGSMILQFRLKTVCKILKPYCMTLKTVFRQFCLKSQILYHKSLG